MITDWREIKCRRCGCRRFWRKRTSEILVDLTHEGAIEGHPFLEGGEKCYFPVVFVCAECGRGVTEEQRQLLEKVAI